MTPLPVTAGCFKKGYMWSPRFGNIAEYPFHLAGAKVGFQRNDPPSQEVPEPPWRPHIFLAVLKGVAQLSRPGRRRGGTLSHTVDPPDGVIKKDTSPTNRRTFSKIRGKDERTSFLEK